MVDKIDEKKKIIILIVALFLFVLLIAGGTYAYLYITGGVVNGTYNTGSTCFIVDYDAKESSPIEGVLFPSSTAKGGLLGQVTMKIDSSCSAVGVGTLYLNVASSTSSVLIGNGYCLNSKTMEQVSTVPVKDASGNVTYATATSSNCANVNNATWIAATATPALKYAVYDGDGTSPVSSGYVNTTGDIVIYDGFDITQTLKTYNIYIWLDGAMSDNSYANKSFSGYVYASATQVE